MYIVIQFNRIINLWLLLISICALVSCGGNQSDPTQAAQSDTGAVALQILLEHSQNGDRYAQSMDACDDVKWVKATILDQSGNELKDGPNWNCEDRSGILTDVPAGPDRTVVVYGIGHDDETILYRGEKSSFTVSPNKTNETGTIVALHIDDVDQDGDGYTPNGGDCNDSDDTIYPDAEDLCNDEIDQDCNPDTCIAKTWYADRDNDGYGNSSETTIRVQCPEHYVADGGDCNDDAGSIHPEAEEMCNGIDDDCDGVRDEGCSWNKTFDSGLRSSLDNYAIQIEQTNDGGYIIAGDESPGVWLHYYYLYEIDEIGVEQKIYDYDKPITDVIQSVDGCYIITGREDLEKVDPRSEEILFTKTYGGNDINYVGARVLESVDGGYILAGTFYSSSGMGASLIKIDTNGDETWHIDFDEPDSSNIQINSITQFEDSGEYAVAGSIQTPDTTTKHPYLIVADSDGKEIWRSIFEEVTGEAHSVKVQKIRPPGSPYFLIAGISNEQDTSEVWFATADAIGKYSGQEVLSGIGDEVLINVITPTTDGSYIIAGLDYGNGNGDALIMKVNRGLNGWNIEWEKTFGGNEYDSAIDVIQSNDGGYVILGNTSSYASDLLLDIWVIKTDAYGNAPQSP